MIQGIDIEFEESVYQKYPYRGINFNPQECEIIDRELETFLAKGTVVRTEHTPGEYISNIFI